MDKIKKALGLGDFGDYQTAIERVQREHEKHLREQEAHLKQVEYDRQRQMMNSAQNYASGGYQSGWNDPRRAMMDNRATPSVQELYENVTRNNAITKEMVNRINRTEKKVEMLTGFYTWITEVYPEIAAQHKAMRDLYEAANAPQQGQEEKAS